MITRECAIAEVIKLKHGESWTYPESDYGKAEILYQYGTYFLFEIPNFGGEPSYTGEFANYKDGIGALIKEIERWT